MKKPAIMRARGVLTDFFELSNGAGEGIRTPDRRITNPLLYQLSYASFNLYIVAGSNFLWQINLGCGMI